MHYSNDVSVTYYKKQQILRINFSLTYSLKWTNLTQYVIIKINNGPQLPSNMITFVPNTDRQLIYDVTLTNPLNQIDNVTATMQQWGWFWQSD